MSPPTRVDGVLAAPRPSFTAADVLDIARRTFRIEADAATDLGSERDQTFLLETATGDGHAVCKLSNAAEDPAILDMEALAALHASRVDPDLPLALPLPVPDAAMTDASPAEHTFQFDNRETRFAEIHVAGNGDQSACVAFFPEAGDYTFYCTIPGHRAAGMEGVIRAEGDPITLEEAEAAAGGGGGGEAPAEGGETPTS